jgi:hypothetical protein
MVRLDHGLVLAVFWVAVALAKEFSGFSGARAAVAIAAALVALARGRLSP